MLRSIISMRVQPLRCVSCCIAALTFFVQPALRADESPDAARTLRYQAAAGQGPAGSLRTVGAYPVQPEPGVIGLTGFTITALPGGKVLLYGIDPLSPPGVPAQDRNAKSSPPEAVLRDRVHKTFSGSVSAGPLVWNPDRHGWEKIAEPPECRMARMLHTATALPNGKILIAGGLCDHVQMGNDDTPVAMFTALSLWDSATQKWEAAPSLSETRIFHTATLLKDGSVLIAGGQSDPAQVASGPGLLKSVESYHDGKAEVLAPMRAARARHTATLLRDGKLLVAGGVGEDDKALSSVEIWDPKAQRWLEAPPLHTPRYMHTATLLDDGRLMVAGGLGTDNKPVSAVEILNIEHDAWASDDPLLLPLYGHSAARLQGGNVLVMGGMTLDARPVLMAMLWEMSTARWRPAGFTAPGPVVDAVPHSITLVPNVGGNAMAFSYPWIVEWVPAKSAARSSVPLYSARDNHTTTLLRDGRVLVAGGRIGNAFVDWAEVYDPDTNRFTATARLHQARHSQSALALPDGRVLVAGGWVRTPERPGEPGAHSPEVWNPETGQWSVINALRFEWQDWVHVARLADGRVLFFASRELFDPTPQGPVEYRAWIWNPKTGLVESRPTPLVPHSKASIAILPDGRVLRVGGNLRQIDEKNAWQEFSDGTAEVWDVRSGSVTPIAGRPPIRTANAKTLVLRNGDVLFVDDEPLNPYSTTRPSTVVIWNAKTGDWKTLPALPIDSRWPVTELQDGTLVSNRRWLLPGANEWTPAAPYPQFAWPNGSNISSSIVQLSSGRLLALSTSNPSAAYYDQKTSKWKLRADSYLAREDGQRLAMTPLADGRLFVTGLVKGRTGRQPAVQVWNPRDDSWTDASSPAGEYAGEIQAIQLASGEVMQVGKDAQSRLLCELWQPTDDSWTVCGFITRTPSVKEFLLGTLENGRAGLMVDANDVMVYGGSGTNWAPMKIEWNSKTPTFGAPIRVGDWVARVRDSASDKWLDASVLASRYYALFVQKTVATAMFWHPAKHEYSYVLRIKSRAPSQGDMGRVAALLPDGCVLSVDPASVFSPETGNSKPLLTPVMGIEPHSRRFTVLPGGLVVVAGPPVGAAGENAGFFRRQASCSGFEPLPGDESFMPGVLASSIGQSGALAPYPTPLPSPSALWTKAQRIFEDYKWLALAIVGPALLYLLLRLFVMPRMQRAGVEAPERRLTAIGVRVVLYGLAAYIILPALWSYVRMREGVNPEDCAASPAACVDKSTGILRSEPSLEKDGAKPETPCRFVGVWSSVQGSQMHRITLKDDGTYLMAPNEYTGSRTYSGYWAVQGTSMVWRHIIGNTGEADINPILPETEDKFTLVERNGRHTQFELISRTDSKRCAAKTAP